MDLLESLNRQPDKYGEASAWNFEKAHSIQHKVLDIVLWSNSENTTRLAVKAPHMPILSLLSLWPTLKTSRTFSFASCAEQLFCSTTSALCLNCKAVPMAKTTSLVMLLRSLIEISILPVRQAYATLRNAQPQCYENLNIGKTYPGYPCKSLCVVDIPTYPFICMVHPVIS